MKKGTWDDSNTDLSRYRLSATEQLQKHAAVVSRNKETARQEWAQRQELLKQGIVPRDMQEVIKKPKPKPAKKECQSTLKRPASARPSATVSTLTKTQQSRYSGFKTTAAVDPQAATLKPVENEGNYRGILPAETPFDSLKRLDEAMNQLERAMMSTIEEPKAQQGSKEEDYSRLMREYATRLPQKENFGEAEDEIQYDRSYLGGGEPGEKQEPEYLDEAEVSESSIFSLSPDHSQESFHPKKLIPASDPMPYSAAGSLPKWQTGPPVSSIAPSTNLLVDSAGYSRPQTSPKQTDDISLEEPNICSVETADYLSLLLAQTRKDLEQMQIPDPTPTLEEEVFPSTPIPPALERNYQPDLMPQPYTITPIARELHNPVVRGGYRPAASLTNSLAIGSSLGPAPQKYTARDSFR